MTEKKIEDILIEKIKTAIDDDSIQIIGSWTTLDNIRKAVEDGEKSGYISVKTYPRAYESYTNPECTINVELTVNIRADIDYDGKTYLDMSEKILNVLYHYQKTYDNVYNDFLIEGEYTPVGFRLDSGDCGIDKENCLWTVSQNCVFFGIIEY